MQAPRPIFSDTRFARCPRWMTDRRNASWPPCSSRHRSTRSNHPRHSCIDPPPRGVLAAATSRSPQICLTAHCHWGDPCGSRRPSRRDVLLPANRRLSRGLLAQRSSPPVVRRRRSGAPRVTGRPRGAVAAAARCRLAPAGAVALGCKSARWVAMTHGGCDARRPSSASAQSKPRAAPPRQPGSGTAILVASTVQDTHDGGGDQAVNAEQVPAAGFQPTTEPFQRQQAGAECDHRSEHAQTDHR